MTNDPCRESRANSEQGVSRERQASCDVRKRKSWDVNN